MGRGDRKALVFSLWYMSFVVSFSSGDPVRNTPTYSSEVRTNCSFRFALPYRAEISPKSETIFGEETMAPYQYFIPVRAGKSLSGYKSANPLPLVTMILSSLLGMPKVLSAPI